MGKQRGIFDLLGTVGNITFVKGPNGIEARQKNFGTDQLPGKRSTENFAEFKRAASAAKLLRHAVKTVLTFKERYLQSRLLTEMMKVVKSDKVSLRGDRTILNGELGFLKKFEFHKAVSLATVFSAPTESVIDRVAGTASVTVQSFLPEKLVVQPQGATHYQLEATAVLIDFLTEESVVISKKHPALAFGPAMVPEIKLDLAYAPNGEQALFILLGIEFLQEVNGLFYSFDKGTFNALSILNLHSGA